MANLAKSAGQIAQTGSAVAMSGIPRETEEIILRNTGAAVMAIGPTNAVTLANGHQIGAGETLKFEAGGIASWFTIGTSTQVLTWLALYG